MVVIEISDILNFKFEENFKENKVTGNRATDRLEELNTRNCAEVVLLTFDTQNSCLNRLYFDEIQFDIEKKDKTPRSDSSN